MYLRGSTLTPNAYSPNPASTPFSKSAPMTLPPTLLTPSFLEVSAKPTMVLLITTIKYTCPHCSEVHSQDSHWFLLTNTKTLALLTTPCSKDSSRTVLLELETHSKIYMGSEEPKPKE